VPLHLDLIVRVDAGEPVIRVRHLVKTRRYICVIVSVFIGSCSIKHAVDMAQLSAESEKSALKMTQVAKREPQLNELIRAIDINDDVHVRALLDGRGVNPNTNGGWRTPLAAAIQQFRDGKLSCNHELVALLLKHGADPNAVDERLHSIPLHQALSMGDIECVNLLTAAGVDIKRIGPTGQSVLDMAVKGSLHARDLGPLKLVLSWGVDANSVNAVVPKSGGRQWTALFTVATSNHDADPATLERVMIELLRAGADPCFKDVNGRTALDIGGNFEAPKIVLDLLAAAMTKCR
jgi:ankyrin repeat protein